MSNNVWSDVDRYLGDLFLPPDDALDAALAASAAAGLPEIQVSPLQGKFLYFLARLQQVQSILEIGTLGGYSTIWLARALPPGGRLVTLEYEPKHAEVARAIWYGLDWLKWLRSASGRRSRPCPNWLLRAMARSTWSSWTLIRKAIPTTSIGR